MKPCKALILSTLIAIPAIGLPLNSAAVEPEEVTLPVTIQGSVNIALNPYQHEASIGDSSTCAPQCILTFPAVPEGQRLVITHVSAQLGPTIDTLLLETGNTTLFIPKGYGDASYLSAPVTYYVDAGVVPTARMFQPNSTEHTSLIVDLVGYLVPLPEPVPESVQ